MDSEKKNSLPLTPIELTSETSYERLKEITGRLEQGITELFESKRYRQYLRVMSRFHNYSFNNTVLIAMQKPDASLVASFSTWEKSFKRSVAKGEKGIKIIAPAPYRKTQEVTKIDPETKKPIIGPDGNPVTEEKEITVPAYKVVSVFDVSQTRGRPLPEIAVDLTGSVEQYEDFFAALEKTSPVPIAFENIDGSSHGYYHLEDKRIAIHEGMSELQTLKTAIHEIAHAKLHDIDLNAPKEEQADRPDRRTREVQAESVAYAVCQHYGLDTSDYSFGYIAGWSSGRELDELKASLETIRGTAVEIISDIDGHFAELKKEREAEKAKHQELEQAPPPDRQIPKLYDDSYMKNATPTQQADAMIEFLGERGQRLGPEERRLIYDYAETLQKADGRIANIINELVRSGYELQHGHVDENVRNYILKEIEAIKTECAKPKSPSLDPAVQPVVTITEARNSSPFLFAGVKMPLSRAETVFRELDETENHKFNSGVKYRIDYTLRGRPYRITGTKDFGHNGEKGILQRYESLPFLAQHCDLSQKEAEAWKTLQSDRALAPEKKAYCRAMISYVRECRSLLNNEQFSLPEPPELDSFGPGREDSIQEPLQETPDALSALEKDLAELERTQETMAAVNAYYIKNNTLDGCPHLSSEKIEELKTSMLHRPVPLPEPFEARELIDNNAEIYRVKDRIAEMLMDSKKAPNRSMTKAVEDQKKDDAPVTEKGPAQETTVTRSQESVPSGDHVSRRTPAARGLSGIDHGITVMCEEIAIWEIRNRIPVDQRLTCRFGGCVYIPRSGVSGEMIEQKYNELRNMKAAPVKDQLAAAQAEAGRRNADRSALEQKPQRNERSI